jgi:hypothetical protein
LAGSSGRRQPTMPPMESAVHPQPPFAGIER